MRSDTQGINILGEPWWNDHCLLCLCGGGGGGGYWQVQWSCCGFVIQNISSHHLQFIAGMCWCRGLKTKYRRKDVCCPIYILLLIIIFLLNNSLISNLTVNIKDGTADIILKFCLAVSGFSTFWVSGPEQACQQQNQSEIRSIFNCFLPDHST